MKIQVCQMVKGLLATLALLCAAIEAPAQTFSDRITIENQCSFAVWVKALDNAGSPPLRPEDNLVRLDQGQSHVYGIPDGGWGGQFRPKFDCDENGNNCRSGQSLPPCPTDPPPYNICEPPAETKVEFFFPFPDTPIQKPFFDISLVDGYTLHTKITPSAPSSGNCTTFDCNLSFDVCPSDEKFGLGDLRVVRDGETVMCLSPCKRWNYPSPYGLNKPEIEGDGRELCCAGGISPAECNAGIVTQTEYVKRVRANCPSAYSFAFDDDAGTHACPFDTNFTVTFCP